MKVKEEDIIRVIKQYPLAPARGLIGMGLLISGVSLLLLFATAGAVLKSDYAPIYALGFFLAGIILYATGKIVQAVLFLKETEESQKKD